MSAAKSVALESVLRVHRLEIVDADDRVRLLLRAQGLKEDIFGDESGFAGVSILDATGQEAARIGVDDGEGTVDVGREGVASLYGGDTYLHAIDGDGIAQVILGLRRDIAELRSSLAELRDGLK